MGILLIALPEDELSAFVAQSEWACYLSLAFMLLYGIQTTILVFRPVSYWVRYAFAGTMIKGVALSFALGIYLLVEYELVYLHVAANLVACLLLASGLIMGYGATLSRVLLPFRTGSADADED